jgi:signal transduction histidine kinase
VSLRAWCGVAYAACAVATVAVIASEPELSLTGGSTWRVVLELTAATLPVAAALAVWRPRFGVLLVAASCAWLAAEWSSPAAGVLFGAGLVVYAAWPVLLAAAALRGLDERPLGPAGRAVVGAGALAAVGLLGLGTAVAFDPAAQGCAACPANPLRLTSAPATVHDLGQAGLALSVVWAAGFAVVAAVRALATSPVRRRLELPVLAPAVLAVALFAVDAAHGLERGFLSNDPTDRALRLAQAAALVLIAGGIVLERLRLRRTRANVARLVLEIGAAPAPGELRARLAASLGDPGLTLLFAVDGAWLDDAGARVELPEDGERAVTIVQTGGRDVLAVLHRRGLLDDPQLVAQLATTARLAIDHERLRAARHARLSELRASRERIVATADRERRALERDLHDGAQQRLVTLGLAIRLARHTSDHEALAEAEERVRAAVVDLRKVAHGLFPLVLEEEGLGPAIDVLSEQSPRLVALRLPDGRLPAAVESAAYFAAHEALRLSDGDVTVDALAQDGHLRMTIAAGGELDGAITQIQDRVGAAGGTATVRAGELLLEMPCGS